MYILMTYARRRRRCRVCALKQILICSALWLGAVLVCVCACVYCTHTPGDDIIVSIPANGAGGHIYRRAERNAICCCLYCVCVITSQHRRMCSRRMRVNTMRTRRRVVFLLAVLNVRVVVLCVCAEIFAPFCRRRRRRRFLR